MGDGNLHPSKGVFESPCEAIKIVTTTEEEG